ncbi:YdcF family protein [Jannaschia aquimarina]|uniref:DUF218 domain-containing protein n=1 Tax=Jannaschia aquimarina TaxID=935700 RepID=A0A0D1EPW2_9RHOB|nr:YdcF family protein [Jannaschia aquimarina]KIT17670.1 hypothetical protein jaqu_05610 [Jannaschia aquimarina]SNS79458.1 DUF218 domain-containing protein [Jannaschia aquimarina]
MIAAIVLGAAVRPDGTPSETLRLRCLHAADLFHRGTVDLLVPTGGGPEDRAEGRIGAALMHEAGVPMDRILPETVSTSTLSNLTHALALLPAGVEQTVLVSNRWHLPRALMIARIVGLPDPAGSGPAGQAPPLWTARQMLREGAAMAPSAVRAIRWARRSGP